MGKIFYRRQLRSGRPRIKKEKGRMRGEDKVNRSILVTRATKQAASLTLGHHHSAARKAIVQGF